MTDARRGNVPRGKGPRLAEKYDDAYSRRVIDRDDVTFIPSGDAARRYRRESIPAMVGFTVVFVFFAARVLTGERTALPIVGLGAFTAFLLWVWISALRRLRTPDDRLPPFGLSIWDDALVVFVGRGVTFVPKSAVQTFDVRRDDAGTALMIVATDARGDTPRRTLGWFTIDADELDATLDAWLTSPAP